jgi:hypothetical protein
MYRGFSLRHASLPWFSQQRCNSNGLASFVQAYRTACSKMPRPSFGAIKQEKGETLTMLALDGNSLVSAILGHFLDHPIDSAP